MNTTVTKSHSINPNVKPGFEARRTTITVTANTHKTSDPAIYPACRERLVTELDMLGVVSDGRVLDQIRGGYQVTVEGHL